MFGIIIETGGNRLADNTAGEGIRYYMSYRDIPGSAGCPGGRYGGCLSGDPCLK